MTMTIGLFVLGLLLVMVGGDRLVDAAVAISEQLGVPHIVVGATIVSLGTTLPEILVSVTAVMMNSADIAAGNAFGSIICNVALIAAISLLFRPVKNVDRNDLSWRIGLFVVLSGFLYVVGSMTGGFGRTAGTILVLSFVLYAYLCVRSGQNSDSEAELQESGMIKQMLILAVCAVLLYKGADLMVDNGILIARDFGVSERVIGLTIIALGTSLPELVTAVSALLKGYNDISLGNVIGANLINVMLVIGIPSMIKGIAVTKSVLHQDLPMGVLVMLILALPLIVKGRGYRLQGAALLVFYFGYIAFQFFG